MWLYSLLTNQSHPITSLDKLGHGYAHQATSNQQQYSQMLSIFGVYLYANNLWHLLFPSTYIDTQRILQPDLNNNLKVYVIHVSFKITSIVAIPPSNQPNLLLVSQGKSWHDWAKLATTNKQQQSYMLFFLSCDIFAKSVQH